MRPSTMRRCPLSALRLESCVRIHPSVIQVSPWVFHEDTRAIALPGQVVRGESRRIQLGEAPSDKLALEIYGVNRNVAAPELGDHLAAHSAGRPGRRGFGDDED